MHNILKKSWIALAVAAVSTNVMAAEVPAGTALAEKQELIWNLGSNPASFDPHKIEGDVEGNVARQLFEGLVTSDEHGNLLPGVATRWEHSPDFKTWTFYLRPEAKWSNGEPVVASDFVYAWQRLADPKTGSPYSTYLEYLKVQNAHDVIVGDKKPTELGLSAPDDHTFVINLSESVPYADRLVEHYVLYPVNKKVIEQFGEQWTRPGNLVGNGAFVLKGTIVNEKTEIERNPQYWNNAKTVLNKVTLLPIENSSTDVARYRAGDSDISGKEIPIELFAKLKKELPNELHVSPVLCTYVYEINTAKAPFNDIRVRQALSLALDRDIITDKVLQQGQIPAYGFAPPYIAGGEKIEKPEWANWDAAKRHEEAKKLLKDAGFDKSNPLNFNLLYNTSENHKKLAIAATSIWKKNLDGAVNVKMENQEWKTYLDTRHQGNYDVARAGWCADYNEASTFLTYFLSYSSNNTAKYKSEDYDNAIKATYQAQSDDERASLYAKADGLITHDVPSVPVYHYVQPRLIKPYVKGFAEAHPGQNYYLKDVYIVKP